METSATTGGIWTGAEDFDMTLMSELLMPDDMPIVAPTPTADEDEDLSQQHVVSDEDLSQQHAVSDEVEGDEVEGDEVEGDDGSIGSGSIADQSSSSDEMSSSSPRDRASSSASTSTSPPVSTHKKRYGRATSARKLEERKARRRAQVAVSARRHRSRKKNELLELRKQNSELTHRLQVLRSNLNAIRPTLAVAAAEERAVAERLKRQHSEKINEQLRLALFTQRRFLGSLKSTFMTSSVANAEINMRQLLHAYTHLGRSPWSRARDYDVICSDAKLDMAVQILLRETEGVDFSQSTITTREINTRANEIGVTAIATYAFEALNLKGTFVSACGAILDCGTEWPMFSAVARHAQVVDAPKANVRYGMSNVHYQSLGDEEGVVVVESRGLTCYRMGDNCGVLLWDYADKDELFPVKSNEVVKRDVVGAAMVRRELCVDGVERVVYRSICTKIHTLPQDPSSSPALQRFVQNSRQGSKVCGAIVYNQILKGVTQTSITM